MVAVILALLVTLSTDLTVIVTYFSPFGVERGVGPGIVVEQTNGSRFCVTNIASACVLHDIASPSTAMVEAYYPDPNPFFEFVCKGEKELSQPEEALLIRCRRVFMIRFPFLISPPNKE